MKKRKFPAGLVISLVVLLGGAGAYGVYNTMVANRTPGETQRILQAEQMKEAMANAPKPDPKATPTAPTKEQMRQQVATTAPAEAPGPSRRRGPDGEDAKPGSSILAPKVDNYKPVPNDSATSSQWYKKK